MRQIYISFGPHRYKARIIRYLDRDGFSWLGPKRDLIVMNLPEGMSMHEGYAIAKEAIAYAESKDFNIGNLLKVFQARTN